MTPKLGRKNLERDAATLRTLIGLSGVPAESTDHGTLTGLTDDDHSQYMHIDTARTVTAQHSFSPSVAQAPFVLGANAQGQVVTGLDADQLDGYHANSFALRTEQFVVLAASATLTNERVLTPGNGLAGTDGGAGSTYTLAVDLASPSGLEFSAGDLQLADSIAGAGLVISSKVLAVGAGSGITVNADNVALTTPGTLSVSSANSSTGNHTHAITSSSNPGAAAAILASDANGYLQLERIGLGIAPSYCLHIQDTTQQMRVEYDSSNYLDVTVVSSGSVTLATATGGAGGNITLDAAGDIIVDPEGNIVRPASSYDVNLGTPLKKYLSLYAAELNVETLVAQDVMATIGGRVLVAPTTFLTADLTAVATTMYVKHNNLAIGDTVRLEANMFVEFMAITGGPTESTELGGNVGFETAGGGGADIWGTWVENAGDGTLANETSIVHSGSDACKMLLGTLGDTYVYQDITVTPNEKYLFTYWLYGNGRVWVYDNSNSADIIPLMYVAGGSSSWEQVRHYFIAPIGCSSIRVYLYCKAAGGSAAPTYFDDVHVGLAQYSYTVTRNLDGTGANAWYAGDAVVNTGAAGDGWIDLYATWGLRDHTEVGPTIAGSVRNSTTYNDWSEYWAIGNLNNLYDYGSDAYGAAFGKYANGNAWLAVDSTSGLRIMKRASGADTQIGRWAVDGTVTIGEVGASKGNVYIASGEVQIRVNTTAEITLSSAGVVTVGDASSPRVVVDGGGIDFKNGAGTNLVSIDATNSDIYLGIPQATKVSEYGIRIRRSLATYTLGRLAFGNDLTTDDDGYFSVQGYPIASGEYQGLLLMPAFTGGVGAYNALSLRSEAPTGSTGLDASMKLQGHYDVASSYVRMYLGGIDRLAIISSELVINEGGGDYNFRVESDTNANMIMVDAGLNAVGIGGAAVSGYPLSVTGDFRYTGDLSAYRNATIYTVYAFVPLTTPLTSTSWDGDARSTTAKTLIDLSAVFGTPAGIKAVLIRLVAKDSGSAGSTTGCWLILSDDNTALSGAGIKVAGLTNDAEHEENLIVPCDANGDVYFQCNASGASTLDVTMQILGYWI